MDLSSLGPLFYLIFALPGFVGVWTLRTLFDTRKTLNGWEWPCWSVLYGIIVFGAWEWAVKNNIQQINTLVSNPLAATIFLSIFAIVLSCSIRAIVFLVKYLLLGVMVLFSILVSAWDEWRTHRGSHN